MSYNTYQNRPVIPNPESPIEFHTQETIYSTLLDGGTLEKPKPNTVKEILAVSTEYRYFYIINEGPGIVHLYIGDVPDSWKSSPKSARRLEPGGFSVSTLESSKAKVSGWSEGGVANLVVDMVM